MNFKKSINFDLTFYLFSGIKQFNVYNFEPVSGLLDVSDIIANTSSTSKTDNYINKDSWI